MRQCTLTNIQSEPCARSLKSPDLISVLHVRIPTPAKQGTGLKIQIAAASPGSGNTLRVEGLRV